jgi:hypothetical protein
MKMFALVCSQGTACHETSLCDKCFTDANKKRIESQINQSDSDRPIPGVWHDCTQNDALECNDCGAVVPVE